MDVDNPPAISSDDGRRQKLEITGERYIINASLPESMQQIVCRSSRVIVTARAKHPPLDTCISGPNQTIRFAGAGHDPCNLSCQSAIV